MVDLPKVNINVLLGQISPVHQQIKSKSPFFKSHVSSDTFFENKYGFRENSTAPQNTAPLTFHFQKRCFKTYRGDVSLQGPSVTDRLKSQFQARRVALGGLQTGLPKEKLKVLSEAESNEKLKGIRCTLSHNNIKLNCSQISNNI